MIPIFSSMEYLKAKKGGDMVGSLFLFWVAMVLKIISEAI